MFYFEKINKIDFLEIGWHYVLGRMDYETARKMLTEMISDAEVLIRHEKS